MISGLLSTLNEEAQEDVLNEELAGSSENVSFNASLENINKSYEALSPTPSMIMKSSRDLEKGSVAAGIRFINSFLYQNKAILKTSWSE
jgi:hypothetical protein